MWAAGWAGDIAWFQLGDHHTRPTAAGGHRVVGTYALHLSCGWCWTSRSGYTFADADSDAAALEALSIPRRSVHSIELADPLGLVIRFENEDALVVDADAASSDEQWRVIQPGLRVPHLVAAAGGVGWHEA